MASLSNLWHRLAQVRSLAFSAISSSATGWNGLGRGTVSVSSPDAATLIFHEAGTWLPEGQLASLRFRNVYRWTLQGDRLRLEHLRFGPEHPVHLVDLVPVGADEWRSASDHICQADCYSANLQVQDDCLALCWQICGPRKDERIEYRYA